MALSSLSGYDIEAICYIIIIHNFILTATQMKLADTI